ncbi:NAD(P)H-binding protein [Nocardia vinacea]|uniref:SDR family oxidoreductase n=1 Tax=Nocardia vinacea TaxID=96468 RepID=UPI00341D7449
MTMQDSTIAVAGATGRLGRHIVDVLTEAGHKVVAMSRSTGVDVVTGAGLAEAFHGVTAVIDASSTPSFEQQAATDFFTASARNLHAAAQAAGVRRIVAVSIIGIDGSTAGYNAAKLVHEQALLAGPVPTRILRAAQFHELVEQMMQWGAQGSVIYIPKMRTQLVSARAVAEQLAEFATGAWSAHQGGPFPEIAGPRAEYLAEMARLVNARRGDDRPIEEVSDPANPDRDLYESGALLPGPDAVLSGPSFTDWLDQQARIHH